jgi:hypothetical protein
LHHGLQDLVNAETLMKRGGGHRRRGWGTLRGKHPYISPRTGMLLKDFGPLSTKHAGDLVAGGLNSNPSRSTPAWRRP